jgi:histidine triad (HIT) family protein
MTIFAQILAGEIPAEIVYEDDQAIALIPRKPLTSVHAAVAEDTRLLGHLLQVCRQVAAEAGLAESGYRVVTNIGEDGGQSVEHLHLHVLGGRSMTWPPG